MENNNDMINLIKEINELGGDLTDQRVEDLRLRCIDVLNVGSKKQIVKIIDTFTDKLREGDDEASRETVEELQHFLENLIRTAALILGVTNK